MAITDKYVCQHETVVTSIIVVISADLYIAMLLLAAKDSYGYVCSYEMGTT